MTKRCPACHQVVRHTKRCEECGQPIPSQRSVEISTRFHGHITYMARASNGQRGRDEVYMRALLRACELETTEGASPYPYIIVDDVLYPKRTTNRSNRQMMQACWACETLAVEWGCAPLPEKYDDEGR